MSSLSFRRLVFLVVLMSFGAANPVHAALLDVADASSIIQSTVTDQDFEFLHAFYGGQPSQTLNYNSTSTATSWSGTLSGNYVGVPVSIAYSSSALSSTGSTWTSTGTYGTGSGTQTWTGGGSATITDTSSTTFNVTFTDSVSVGANTGSVTYTIPGTAGSTVPLGGSAMYGDPSNPEAVGTGTVTLNGVTYTAAVSYFSYLRFWPYIICDYNGNYPFPPWIPSDNYYKTTSASATSVPFSLDGYITSVVPEPTGLILLGVGLCGVSIHVVMRSKGATAGVRTGTRQGTGTQLDSGSPSGA